MKKRIPVQGEGCGAVCGVRCEGGVKENATTWYADLFYNRLASVSIEKCDMKTQMHTAGAACGGKKRR